MSSEGQPTGNANLQKQDLAQLVSILLTNIQCRTEQFIPYIDRSAMADIFPCSPDMQHYHSYVKYAAYHIYISHVAHCENRSQFGRTTKKAQRLMCMMWC